MARRACGCYAGAMSDAFFFAFIGLLAAGMIAVALVWPQGLGTPSPAPFGHPLAPAVAAAPPPPVAPTPIAPPVSSARLKGSL